MSKTAFDKISEGLRDAMAGNFARIHIDGVTWVRADSGSPAELADEIKRLSFSIRGLDEQRLQEKGLWENEERRLKAEIERLERELAARQWQPIQTAPKHEEDKTGLPPLIQLACFQAYIRAAANEKPTEA